LGSLFRHEDVGLEAGGFGKDGSSSSVQRRSEFASGRKEERLWRDRRVLTLYLDDDDPLDFPGRANDALDIVGIVGSDSWGM